MNRLTLLITGLFFGASLFQGIANALKYGVSWEVQTSINGVVTTSTQNSIQNILMAFVFLFMFITSGLTMIFLGWITKGDEKK
jgi:membrane protease YdiL (CAAX protease family)